MTRAKPGTGAIAIKVCRPLTSGNAEFLQRMHAVTQAARSLAQQGCDIEAVTIGPVSVIRLGCAPPAGVLPGQCQLVRKDGGRVRHLARARYLGHIGVEWGVH